MPKLASLHLRMGVLFMLLGMAMGLQISIGEDRSIHVAHAHLNLLGFVGSMLFGLFYLAVPAAANDRQASPQFWLWSPGVALMVPGIALAELGRAEGAPLAAAGSFMVFVSMILFAFIAFRATGHSTRSSVLPVAPMETARQLA